MGPKCRQVRLRQGSHQLDLVFAENDIQVEKPLRLRPGYRRKHARRVVELGDLESSTQSDHGQPDVVRVRAAPREVGAIPFQIPEVLRGIDDAGYAGNQIQVARVGVLARSPAVVRSRPAVSHTYAVRPKAMNRGRVGFIALDQSFEPVLRIDDVVIRSYERRIQLGFAINVREVLGVRPELLCQMNLQSSRLEPLEAGWKA